MAQKTSPQEIKVRCTRCGSQLALQPVLKARPDGQLRQDFVYRCPNCSDIVLHPHPTEAEAAAWVRTHE